ncbi:MAG TPA: DUF4177 domain-containing protein [Anaeromyxobacteraceae bacterium]|nr:DUF4177 domain-containing protein [Anaeromyxobacteraceae bacterium]
MTAPRLRYKVVEVAPVAEDTLQKALEERTAEGWGIESVHFVTREGSHRPAMAYLFFTRVRDDDDGGPGRSPG